MARAAPPELKHPRPEPDLATPSFRRRHRRRWQPGSLTSALPGGSVVTSALSALAGTCGAVRLAPP